MAEKTEGFGKKVANLALTGLAVVGLYTVLDNIPYTHSLINELKKAALSAAMPDGYVLSPQQQALPPATPGVPVIPVSPIETAAPVPVAPEQTANTNRAKEWSNFWPKTSEQAAKMFGGSASDWKMSDKWDGTKTYKQNGEAEHDYGQGLDTYLPTEWVPTNPNNPPYYWPSTPEEAAAYFFPGQNVDARFLEKNKYGGWHLREDHWMFDGNADKTVLLHRGEVTEIYTANGDQSNPEIERDVVAFGGTSDTGILISAKGQGLTVWPPGTDATKIALGMEVQSNTHYNFGQLGPDVVNFTPIYNAPGFDTIGAIQSDAMSVANVTNYDVMSKITGRSYGNLISQNTVLVGKEKIRSLIQNAGGTNPQTVRKPQNTELGFVKDPWAGMTSAKRNRGGNGSYSA